MERKMTAILIPANTAGSLEVLMNKMAILSQVDDIFNAVVPSELSQNYLLYTSHLALLAIASDGITGVDITVGTTM